MQMSSQNLKEVFIPVHRFEEGISEDLLHLVDFSHGLEAARNRKRIRELKNAEVQKPKILQHMSANEVEMEFKKLFPVPDKPSNFLQKDSQRMLFGPSVKKLIKPCSTYLSVSKLNVLPEPAPAVNFTPALIIPIPIVPDEIITNKKSQIKKKEQKEQKEKKLEPAKIKNKIEFKASKNAKEIKCQECSFNTKNRAKLMEHYKIKHDQRAFKLRPVNGYCVLCKAYVFSLSRHIREKHKTKNNDFKCTICEKKFPCTKYFIDHLKIHLNVKPYVCLICDHQTSQISNMKSHVSTHEKYPFV